MATDCLLPDLGENIDTATVVEVFVAVGDTVALEQPLLSLETDKAEFELPSPVAGRVTELLVSVGDDVSVGHVILRVDGAEGADLGAPADAVAPAGARDGDEPSSPAEAAEAGEAPEDAEAAGTAEPAGSAATAAPGEAAATAGPGRGASPSGEAESAASAGSGAPRTPAAGESARGGSAGGDASGDVVAADVAAAPSVRRLARSLGVDLRSVAASGAAGRVLADDVHRHVRERLAATAAGAPAHVGGELPDFSTWGPVRIEPMSKVRRKTAEQMTRAWATIPHVTHHDRANVTELDRLRKQYSGRVEEAGGKLTMTAVLLKVLGSALKRYPKFNASVDMDGSAIVYKDYVHIGVAVDTERGLLVPVVRDADRKNIVELALGLSEVSERARSRNITPDMLQGATFTITNLGGVGGIAFSPLINPPEVAVLGVSRARLEPVYVDGQPQPRLMLPLAVSYDHRVIDGADAARFLRWVCEALEEPFLMDLEGK